MTLRRLTPAVAEAVPLDDFLDHLRLSLGLTDPPTETPAAERALACAVAAIERSTSLACLRQTWKWELPTWTNARSERLPILPVLTVASVSAIAEDGRWTPFEPSTWRHSDDQIHAVGAWLPAAGPSGVQVVFEAGFGDHHTDLPADLKQAVLLLAAHYFERRHAVDAGNVRSLPNGLQSLLAPFRQLRL
ncbi:MAG: head-tail connector protein [Pseudomonadota bacterium]